MYEPRIEVVAMPPRELRSYFSEVTGQEKSTDIYYRMSRWNRNSFFCSKFLKRQPMSGTPCRNPEFGILMKGP